MNKSPFECSSVLVHSLVDCLKKSSVSVCLDRFWPANQAYCPSLPRHVFKHLTNRHQVKKEVDR